MKSNLFGNKIFAIDEDSFAAESAFLERCRRLLVENGGRVVSTNAKANYVLFEDGTDPEIWKKLAQSSTDEKARNIVHPRWVEHCVIHR